MLAEGLRKKILGRACSEKDSVASKKMAGYHVRDTLGVEHGFPSVGGDAADHLRRTLDLGNLLD